MTSTPEHAAPSYCSGARHTDQADSQETSQPPLIVSMPTTPGRRPLPCAQAEADRLLSLFPERPISLALPPRTRLSSPK